MIYIKVKVRTLFFLFSGRPGCGCFCGRHTGDLLDSTPRTMPRAQRSATGPGGAAGKEKKVCGRAVPVPTKGI